MRLFSGPQCKLNANVYIALPADKVCSGEGTLALTPQCLQVLHESFERILPRRDNRAVNGSLPMSLNEFAGYRELSFMYDIVQVAASLKVSKDAVSLCLLNCIHSIDTVG